MSKTESRGYSGRTRAAIRSVGHTASGGHASRSQSASRLSPYAKINRNMWEGADPLSGGIMPNEFQEYPKHVYPDLSEPKKYVVVHSEEQEHAALGGQPVVQEDDERKRLLALAEVKDVKIDKRWSIPKMAKAIDDAGFDSTLNPFA